MIFLFIMDLLSNFSFNYCMKKYFPLNIYLNNFPFILLKIFFMIGFLAPNKYLVTFYKYLIKDLKIKYFLFINHPNFT